MTRIARPGRRRLLALAALAVVALGAAGAAAYFRFARPVGRGPAGPEVPAGPFRRVWTERPVRLVGLGDSVTAGFGAPPGRSYFERLVRPPGGERGVGLAEVLPRLEVENLAVSGSTSIDHLRQVERLEPCGPETLGVFVVTTGGNDLIHNYGRTPPREGASYGASWEQAKPWIDRFGRRLEAIVAGIEAKSPGGCRIYLGTIYDPTDGVGDIGRAGLPPWPDGLRIHRAYNDVLRRCAARHPTVTLVDIHRAFLGHGLHCTEFWRPTYRSGDPHYWYHENLEDPNPRGYDALARLFLNAMAETWPGAGEGGR